MVEDKDIMKTGTTTVAIVCKDGIVLAADKRVTSGYLIAYKKFEKIANITDAVAVTMAGTVSDIQLLIKLIRAELQLKKIRTGKDCTVKEATNLLATIVYQNIRKFSLIPGISHFIVAGLDSTGLYAYEVGADGTITEVDDYTCTGSGSVMAYGVLETLYKKEVPLDECVKLAAKSINAAVQRDIASGNGIDIVTITKAGIKRVVSKEVAIKIEV